MSTIVVKIEPGGVIPRLKGIIKSVTFICTDTGGGEATLVVGSAAPGSFPGSSVVGGGVINGPMVAGHHFEAVAAVVWDAFSYEINQPIDVNTLLTLTGNSMIAYVVIELS